MAASPRPASGSVLSLARPPALVRALAACPAPHARTRTCRRWCSRCGAAPSQEDSSGARVLCIELPKREPPSGTGRAAKVDCVFDESLHVRGTPCLRPGLSQGTITIDLPDAPAAPAKGARGGAPQMCAPAQGGAAEPARVDVSDLGLTMADLDVPLPELEVGGTGSLVTEGFEAVSRLPGSQDQGCAWRESSDTLEATLTIPGLRGQPAMCLAVELTETTATVTAFGQQVWSCVLRGTITLDGSTAAAEDGPDMLPVLTLRLRKPAGAQRWGGLIQSIGEDSVLQ